jgi:hypothetical protein
MVDSEYRPTPHAKHPVSEGHIALAGNADVYDRMSAPGRSVEERVKSVIEIMRGRVAQRTLEGVPVGAMSRQHRQADILRRQERLEPYVICGSPYTTLAPRKE